MFSSEKESSFTWSLLVSSLGWSLGLGFAGQELESSADSISKSLFLLILHEFATAVVAQSSQAGNLQPLDVCRQGIKHEDKKELEVRRWCFTFAIPGEMQKGLSPQRCKKARKTSQVDHKGIGRIGPTSSFWYSPG